MNLLSFGFDRHVYFLIDAKIFSIFFAEVIVIDIERGGEFGEFDVRMECQMVLG
jgi:hypothetical protein